MWVVGGALLWLGLLEVLALTQVVVVELVAEGAVSGFGEHALLLKDGEDAHGLEDRRRQ